MIHVSSRTMETSFYADDAFMAKENIRNLKKSMTLDLGGGNNGPGGGGGGGIVGIVNGPTAAKRQKFNSLLSSPDLNLLKLASPDLENLIIEQNNGQVTTTPTPSQFLFTKNVTEEQEMYARGFVDALAELHHGTSSMDSVTTTTSNGSSNSGGGNGETNSATNSSTSSYSLSAAIAAAQSTGGVPHHIAHPYSSATTTTTVGVVTGAASQFVTGAAVGNGVVNIKEEPQTVPSGCSSPPLSPIDMMAQERIKLERKRQRNRVAASKCRKRKLERIARLEDKVKLLKDENTELGTVVTKLKDHICHLKQQLMDHVNSGCQIMTPSQYLS